MAHRDVDKLNKLMNQFFELDSFTKLIHET